MGKTKQKQLEEYRQYLLMETIAMLSADLFQEIYDKCETWSDTCEEIIKLAQQFEEELDWDANCDEYRDYIEELEKFEQKVRANLKNYD